MISAGTVKVYSLCRLLTKFLYFFRDGRRWMPRGNLMACPRRGCGCRVCMHVCLYASSVSECLVFRGSYVCFFAM